MSISVQTLPKCTWRHALFKIRKQKKRNAQHSTQTKSCLLSIFETIPRNPCINYLWFETNLFLFLAKIPFTYLLFFPRWVQTSVGTARRLTIVYQEIRIFLRQISKDIVSCLSFFSYSSWWRLEPVGSMDTVFSNMRDNGRNNPKKDKVV